MVIFARSPGRQGGVVHVQFQLNAKAIDNELLDEEWMIILGLDTRNNKMNITILNASLLL
ncbi:MAG: hypothetical protein ACE5R6_00755 [Candidatus Heimdallarchaeota archaeon]